MSEGKSARFFAGLKVLDGDPENGFLRVTHYGSMERLHGASGSIEFPAEHVRFSVWIDDTAKCVISLPASEARELASFLAEELTQGAPSGIVGASQ